MTTARARRISLDELELLDRKVTRDGGALRAMKGEDYGLATSFFRSEIVPGSGPEPHTHPYHEIFVIESGQGRYRVEGTLIDAVGGDIVIVPAGAVHGFENTGSGLLRHVAVHEAPTYASELARFEGT
jgi:quercetin dioxygenase-like cupin family protein